MTTTLNASTAGVGGFIATSDNSGVLALQTAGTTAVSISASQVVTVTNDASISGLTVGKGTGAVSTTTVVGNGAMVATNTGLYNSAFGYSSLAANTSGSENTAHGFYSLFSNTTGSFNAALGSQALRANTTGNENLAVGQYALTANTTGYYNVAVGRAALYSNVSGLQNTAVGRHAVFNNTASDNTGVGFSAMGSNTTGANNVAVGSNALQANTTASGNTAVGYQAGYAITTSGDNTCVGYTAGNNITTGATNTCIGRNAIPNAATDSNETVVGGGFPFQGKGSNTGYFGGSSGAYNQANSAVWSTTSDRRLKKNIVDNTDGLSKITSVRVRNFEYRLKEEITELNPSNVIVKTGVQLGVIAQELQAVLPDCVKEESSGVLSVNSENLTWYMINAIKELKAEFDAYKATHP